MDIELILKRKFKEWISIALVLVMLTYLLCGCDSRAGRYPRYKGSEWVCDDPYFTISYADNPMGDVILVWNNETIAADLVFSLGTYCVFPANSSHYDDRLFNGTWNYRKGDLVLFIREDLIFDGQYTELVFSKVD